MQPFSRALVFGAVLSLGFPGVRLSAQATDAASGTWELNLAKSKFSPGPSPRSQTRMWEETGAEVKYTLRGIDAQGKPTLLRYSARYDGKDYPVAGSQDFDAISLKRVNAVTAQATLKRRGKVVQTSMRVVSRDGKTLTLTTRGTNAKGQAVNNVAVFEKRSSPSLSPSLSPAPGTQVVSCASQGDKMTFCKAGGTVTEARLLQDRSGGRCGRPGAWGYAGVSIWVKFGCQGDFEVRLGGRP